MQQSGSSKYNMLQPWEQHFLGEANQGVGVLSERLDRGFMSAKELGDWIAARAQAEQIYANELTRISKSSPYAAEQGTLKAQLGKMNSITEGVAHAHLHLSGKLMQEMETSIQTFLHDQRKLKQIHDIELDKCVKQIAKELATVDRLKKDYYAKGNLMTQAVQQAAQGQTAKMTKKDYEKVMEKAIKAKKDADLAEGEYKAAVNKTSMAQEQLEQRIILMAQQYQQSESNRIEMMKTALQRIADMQFELIAKETQNYYGEFRSVIDQINPTADLNEFCSTYRTGTELPPRIQFQSCFPGSPATIDRRNNLSTLNKSTGSNLDGGTPSLPDRRNPSPLTKGTGSNMDVTTAGTLSTTPNRVNSPGRQSVSSLHRSNSAKQAIIAHVTIGNDDTPRPISNPVTQQQLASNLHSELANRLSMSAQPSTVKSKSKTKIVHSQSNLDANPNLRSSGHSSPVFLSRDDLDGDAPKAQTRDSALLETSIPPLRVDTSGGAAEKSISSPANSAKLDSGYVVSPASVVTSTEPPAPAHGRVFSRKTVKMEGWLDICEEATAGTWSHNWCVLEGGFIWLFDDPAESSKPKGLNKPKAMLSTAKCSVAAGAMTEKGWQAPEPDAKGPHVFALSTGKKQLVIAAPTEEDMRIWMDELEASGKKK